MKCCIWKEGGRGAQYLEKFPHLIFRVVVISSTSSWINLWISRACSLKIWFCKIYDKDKIDGYLMRLWEYVNLSFKYPYSIFQREKIIREEVLSTVGSNCRIVTPYGLLRTLESEELPSIGIWSHLQKNYCRTFSIGPLKHLQALYPSSKCFIMQNLTVEIRKIYLP